MSERRALEVWPTVLAIALAAAPVAWWVLLRSGKEGWSKFAMLWIACYCGVVVLGIAAATVFAWLRPVLARRDAAPALEDAAARAKFEETVMVAIIAVGLFALLSVLIR